MAHKKKKFDAVEMSRKWREEVSREVAGMSIKEKIEYFKRYSSVDALFSKTEKRKYLSKAA